MASIASGVLEAWRVKDGGVVLLIAGVFWAGFVGSVCACVYGGAGGSLYTAKWLL